jgi:formylglycine-generating enzyme required for sulfatase activity
VFSLSFAPQLTITPLGTNVILTWPTNVDGFDYSGFTLQSATNLISPAGWSTVVPLQSVVNGLNTVTNPISGTQQFYRLYQSMALIPAGSFTMGDTLDGESDAIPTNVYVSAFYMDVNLVSLSQWQGVYSYATSQGYNFARAGTDKAANTPVGSVDWFDCVKWCNARSQQASLTPVYYTDTNLTQVFTNGDNGTTVYANWGANGYRLPTEAEWEKAARGGLRGQRFPWGNTISESQANYYSTNLYSYDLGPNGYNAIGNYPTDSIGTSPVGSFAPNGYGLYDMAGNVFEWCWDWYAGPTYPAGSPYLGGTDPRGPVGPLSVRVSRGGFWSNHASSVRCAYRLFNYPFSSGSLIGFRCVRGY